MKSDMGPDYEREVRRTQLKASIESALRGYAGTAVAPELVDRLTQEAIATIDQKPKSVPMAETPARAERQTEIPTAPPELLAGWETFFNSGGGRWRTDVRKLENTLRASLGDRFLGVTKHPQNEGVAVIRVRLPSGTEASFAAPLHSIYRSLHEFFQPTKIRVEPLAEITHLKVPGVFDSATMRLLKKGLVETETS